MLTADVEGIDGHGIRYRDGAGGTGVVAWDEVKAVMLATTDHMLESGGYLLSMADAVRRQDRSGEPADTDALRRFAFGLLRQAAPRICPRGGDCGLRGLPG